MLTPQPEEISRAAWLSPAEALERITYQNARNLLLKALAHMETEGD